MPLRVSTIPTNITLPAIPINIHSPIFTYGWQGTAKPGVKGNDHAIIYTSSHAPKELEGEKKLLKRPVRVNNISDKEKLDKASRVNYSKVYTIEHNIRVCFIGEIHKDSKAIFFTDFKRTFEKDDESEGDTRVQEDIKVQRES